MPELVDGLAVGTAVDAADEAVVGGEAVVDAAAVGGEAVVDVAALIVVLGAVVGVVL